MAQENEIIVALHQGCLSVEQAPEGSYVVLKDYDCEGHDPEELHVNEDDRWYLYLRLYADRLGEVIKPAKEKSAQAQLDAQLDAEVRDVERP